MAGEALQGIIQQLRATPVAREGATIAQMRENFAGLTAGLPVPEHVPVEPAITGGVPGEWLTPAGAIPARVVLYLHGGGYLIGSPATHRGLAARIAAAAGARVLSLDYRLAPEHPFPAAVNDATAAYRALLAQDVAPDGIVIAGDSAGGGLALAVLVALRDAGIPLPAAGVVLSPWVDLAVTGESMTTRAAVDPMVQREAVAGMAQGYLQGADARHPYASPLYADLTGLPPLLIQVGTSETLLDDATRMANKARVAGVDVALEPWEEMIHVFQLFAPLLPEGQQAIDRIGAFVRQKTAAAVAPA